MNESSVAEKTEKDETRVPDGYEETSRAAYDSQDGVARAWRNMKWPSHNSTSVRAYLYTGTPGRGRANAWGRRRTSDYEWGNPKGAKCNFYAEQKRDGSGTLWHYRTREAVRTRSGLVLDNRECWATGLAHCSPPPSPDAHVPISAVESALPSDVGIHDVDELIRGADSVTVLSSWNAMGEPEAGVAVFRDPSGRHGQQWCTMRLMKEETRAVRRFHVDGDREAIRDFVFSLLTPEVAESDLPVVDSAEYTKSRLSKEELDAHLQAGGKTRTYSRKWRGDVVRNTQHFRADLRGSVIVRQGEWFFIPTAYEPTEAEINAAPSAPLGDHRPERKRGAAKTPVDGGDGQKIYVQGLIRHRTGDHDAVHLGDTWHRAVTHDRDVTVADTSSGGGGPRRD